MVSTFTIFFIVHIFFFKFFLDQYNRFLHFHVISTALLSITSFFLFKTIIFIASSLMYSQDLFIQSLRLHTSCLFSLLLNDDIVDTENSDGICSPTFVADEFSGLFLHPSIFSIKQLRFL